MTDLPPPQPPSPPSPPPKKRSKGCVIACVVVGVCALVLIPIAGLVLAILMPAVFGALEMANRASCANNLSQIGKAGQAYAAAHKQQWPKIPYEKDAPWNEIGNTRKDQLKAGEKPPVGQVLAEDDSGRQVESNTANLWALVSAGYVTPATFICPSTDNQRDDTVTDFTAVRDFRGPSFVSYSFQNCWGDYRLRSTGSTNSSAFAIAADANPQRADFTAAGGAAAQYLAKKPRLVHETWGKEAVAGAWELNSPNHHFRGQNVLYLDGHVEWTDNPWCGVMYDNIWVMRNEGGTAIQDAATATLEALRSWDDGKSYDGKKALPADSVDDSFLVP